MKVILCDDNKLELKQLKTLTLKYLEIFKTDVYTIHDYDYSKKLIFDLEDIGKADLYILDIDMPEPNGIQIAKKIKTTYPLSLIYFYTSHSEFAADGYRVEARRFLIKGGDEKYFAEAMEYACKTCEKLEKECISLPFSHDITNVPIAEIMYVKREHRKVYVYTQSKSIVETSMSIGNLFESLSKPQFIFIDRGIILNMDYIYSTDRNQITLFNKDIFYISQRRMMDVKKEIALYWRGRL